MTRNTSEHIRQVLDNTYRRESRRIPATLIRMLGELYKNTDWEKSKATFQTTYSMAKTRANK